MLIEFYKDIDLMLNEILIGVVDKTRNHYRPILIAFLCKILMLKYRFLYIFSEVFLTKFFTLTNI